jgi:hypothetical protein
MPVFRTREDYIGTWHTRDGRTLEITEKNLPVMIEQYRDGKHKEDPGLDLIERRRGVEVF